MFATVKQWLTPPTFEDEAKTRIARNLYVFLYIALPSASTAAILCALLGRPVTALALAVTVIALLGALWLARRAHLKTATFLALTTLLGLLTFLLYIGQGIHSTMLVMYPVVIILASLLLNRRGFVALILLSLASVNAIVLSELGGAIHTPYSAGTSLDDLLAISILLIATAVIVRLLSESLTRSLARARESEQRLRAIFDSVNDAIFVHALPTGEILDVNPKMCEMYGYTREQARQLTIDTISAGTPPYTQPDALEWIRKAATGKPQMFEWHAQDKNGRLFWVEVNMRRATIGDQERVLVVARDITERHQAQERERAARQRLHAVIDAANELIACDDLDTVYRRAVELAREKLGLERCGLYLLEKSQQHLHGTYGTDDHGHTTDERAGWLSIREHPEVLAPPDKLWAVTVGEHTYWDGERHPIVGTGWVASTVIRSAIQPVGILYNDTAITHAPLDDSIQDAVAVYCSLLGNIIERKRAELELERLLEREQHRVALLRAMSEIALDLSAQLEIPTLLGTIIEQAAWLVGAPMGALWLLQPDGQTLARSHSYNLPPEDTVHRLRLGEGLSGHVAQSGQPLVLEDYSQWPGRAANLEPLPYRAMLAVPIKWQEQVLGTIGVIDTRPARFGLEQVETVSLLAAQAAVAIQNARLFEATRQRVGELQVLHAVAVAATEALDEDMLIERVMHIIGETLFPDYFCVSLVDPTLGVLRPHPSSLLSNEELKSDLVPLGQGIAGVVAQRGQAWRVPDITQILDYRVANPLTRSELAVPLRVADRVLGVINIESVQFNAFSEDDERLLTTLAGQLATAIERLRSNSEREGLIKELEAKNVELEQFTYTVSHDLKAPLITIRGFLGFLEKDALDGNVERLKADMARIVEATNKMQRLLNELLELSRIGRMMNPPQAVPFETIVREALELVRGRIQACGVQVDIAPNLPTVYGDRARLVEVVQNLVDNACKFMGDQPQPRIEIGQPGTMADGKLMLYVRDNGMGIEPQHHERVFGLFNKLDTQSEGTGIGLALVKRIIEFHGGRIWVESEGFGTGSVFHFTLPSVTRSEP